MYRKKINIKSIILKLLILYLGIYLSALFLRFNYNFESLITNIKYEYIILINIFSVSLGLPLSIVFDLILIKIFGIKYIIFFAPILTFIGFFQITILRKINIKFIKNNFLIKKIKKNKLYNFFENITFKPMLIFIIRAFPILPFLLGSYFIASSTHNKKIIFIYSLIGTYLYYFSIFIIILKA